MFEAMEPIGIDTLKATRSLEAAGFDAAQAEALVTVFGGPVLGNVATKEDFRGLRAEFRDLRGEFRDLRTEFGDLRTELAELRTRIDQHVTKAQMYKLLLVQATVIVGLIVGLQQLF